MADTYTVGQIGIEFSGQLSDVDDRNNVVPVNLERHARVFVRFTRPDGTKFERDAELRDTSFPQNTDVVYRSHSESVIDQVGYWEYSMGVTFQNGNHVISSEKEPFWAIAG